LAASVEAGAILESQLVTFIPRAIAAGTEIRDLAMVGKTAPNRSSRLSDHFPVAATLR